MKKHIQKDLSLVAAALLVGSLGFGNSALAQNSVTPHRMYLAAMPHFTLKKHLSCKAWGSPAEFPRTVLLTNDGSAVIAKGTRVHYVTKGGKRHGDYTFTKKLVHGASVYAPLSGDTAAGVPCTVSFVAPRPHVMRHAQMGAMKPGHIKIFQVPMHVKCVTAGDGEFVNKAILTNDRLKVIPAGTGVHYAVNSKVQGNYTFAAPLRPQQKRVITLSSYTANNLSCSVTFQK
jgi:hypothetical protein